LSATGEPRAAATDTWEKYAMGLGLNLLAKYYVRLAKRWLTARVVGLRATITRLV
jgi:hypothetical protein